jgi:hypothetical protein
MPHDYAHQGRDGIPEPERQRDLSGMAPPEPKRPKCNRGPEVVEAERKPEDEKVADQLPLRQREDEQGVPMRRPEHPG